MKFLISRANSYIKDSKRREGGYWHLDMEAFYNNVEEILKEENIPFDIIDARYNIINESPGTISLCYHSVGNYKNVWHIKKGYIPGYLYFDKTGYSGWSELGKNYTNNYTLTIEEIWSVYHMCDEYILNNESKVAQPESIVPKEKYVLVLCQQPKDTVSKLAWIKTVDLAQKVTRAYKDTDIKVLVKPHPCGAKVPLSGEIVEGSIHSLIGGAKAVYTVNSGSGFEALMHFKPVFVSGDSDYKWECGIIKNYTDIVNSIDLIDNPVDLYKRAKFLHYCFNHHFVNAYDKESVRKKLLRTVNEYKKYSLETLP